MSRTYYQRGSLPNEFDDNNSQYYSHNKNIITSYTNKNGAKDEFERSNKQAKLNSRNQWTRNQSIDRDSEGYFEGENIYNRKDQKQEEYANYYERNHKDHFKKTKQTQKYNDLYGRRGSQIEKNFDITYDEDDDYPHREIKRDNSDEWEYDVGRRYSEISRGKIRRSIDSQNDIEERHLKTINNIMHIRRQDFEENDYVYKGKGEYGSTQKSPQRSFDMDDQYNSEREENRKFRGYGFKRRNHDSSEEDFRHQKVEDNDEEENLTYEQIIQDHVNIKRSLNSKSSIQMSTEIHQSLLQKKAYERELNFSPINSAKQKQNTNPKKNLDLITLRSDYQEGPKMKQFQTKVFDMNTEGEEGYSNIVRVPSQSQIKTTVKQRKKTPNEEQNNEEKYIPRTKRDMVEGSEYEETQFKREGEYQAERDVSTEKTYIRQEWPQTIERKNRWEKTNLIDNKNIKTPSHQVRENKQQGLTYRQIKELEKEARSIKDNKFDNEYGENFEQQETQVNFEESQRGNKYNNNYPTKRRLTDHNVKRLEDFEKENDTKRKSKEVNFWSASSPNRYSQLQDNASKRRFIENKMENEDDYNYVQTNGPVSGKKSRLNTWAENAAYPANEIFSQKEITSPHKVTKPTTPVKHVTPNKKFIGEHQREKSLSQIALQSKNSSCIQTPLTASPTHSHAITKTIADQIITATYPPMSMSYVQSSATTPTQNQVQVQLPLSVNPVTPINVNYGGTNTPNMSMTSVPQQTQYNSFVNQPYNYSQTHQGHLPIPNISQNYPYQPIHPHPMYGNPQLFQAAPPSLYVGGPQNIYPNMHPLINPQMPNSYGGYYSNYSVAQPQMSINPTPNTNYIGMHSDHSIISQSGLRNVPLTSNYNSRLSTVKEKGENINQQIEPKANVKNYIKNQEELLKKLDEDRRKLVERLKDSPKMTPHQKETMEYPQSLILNGSGEKSEESIQITKSYQNLNRSPKQNLSDKPLDVSTNKVKTRQNSGEKDLTKAEDVKSTDTKIEHAKESMSPTSHNTFAEKDSSTQEKPKRSVWEERKKSRFIPKDNKPKGTPIKDIPSKIQSPKPNIEAADTQNQIISQIKQEKEQTTAWRMEFPAEQKGNNLQESALANSNSLSLADMFLKKKKDLVEKFENHKDHPKHEEKESRPLRTKEELLKQRKAMMEYRKPAAQRAKSEVDFGDIRSMNKSPGPGRGNLESMISNPYSDAHKVSKEPNPGLLNRLAFGERAKVTKEEMIALTSKNYELLPEIKKKKEEEKKKEEAKKRMEKAKELDQKRRAGLRRNTLKNFG